MKLSSDLLNTLLKKIGEIITTTEEQEEKTPREEFNEYVNEKEDVLKDNPLKIITKKPEEKVKFVYLKPKTENNVVLQQIEVLKKDREMFDKKEKELAVKEAQIADQHYSLQRAKQELEKNGNRTEKN
jgi:hypothetical protein